jgi:nitrite reductase/ring-hydroxylating ferredoxin subunit
MLVYVAYAFLVVHVVFGALQAETHGFLTGLVGGGMIVVLGLHLVSGWRECKPDNHPLDSALDDGFVEACHVVDIPENRARIVSIAGERVAIFKYDGKVCAVSNVCQHQNGPLGEGKIVHGCITCPWHGYQYLPETGASPPPFVEKIPIFKVKIQTGIVHVSALPELPGTYVAPASIVEEGI